MMVAASIRSSVLCSAVLLTTTAPASAQSALGRVLDLATSRPVNQVLMELVDSADAVHKSALTDSTGWFRLRADRMGTYRVRGSGLGYATVVSQPLLLDQGMQYELEVSLQPEAVALEAVRVVAERNLRSGRLAEYYDRMEWTKRTGFGRVFTRTDIDAAHPQRLGQLWDVLLRRDCRYTFFLEGLETPRDVLESSVLPDDVEGVEIYRSLLEVPAEYQLRVTCGAVMVWLRRDMMAGRSISWRRALLTIGGIVAFALLLNVLW